MKIKNIIRLSEIATTLRNLKSDVIINGNEDVLMCSQKALNGLGDEIKKIVEEESNKLKDK